MALEKQKKGRAITQPPSTENKTVSGAFKAPSGNAYEQKVAQAKKLLRESVLREFLYTTDENGNTIDNASITDISFNGKDMYVQDNLLGRYKVDSERDPRIRAGKEPIMPNAEAFTSLGRQIQNTMGANWNVTEPIMDVELGELRTNFMYTTVSPFGVTFALRVSRPRLAVSNIAELCDEETAQLLSVFIRSDFNLLISGQTGSGKALINSSKIPTPNGYKRLDTLKLGDTILDRLGKPTRITGVFPQGKLAVYQVTLEDGRKILCNDEHIWTTVTNEGDFVNYTAKDIMLSEKEYDIPLAEAIDFEPNIKSNDTIYKPRELRLDILKDTFRRNGVLNENNELELRNLHKFFLREVREIAYSLGYSSEIVYSHSMGEKTHKLILHVPNKDKHEFLNETFVEELKGLENVPDTREFNKIKIKEIKPLNYQDEMTCLMVDNHEHLFLADNFVVTHNTELQKALIGYIPQNKKITLMEDTMDSHIKAIYPQKDINSWCTAGDKESENYVGFQKLIKSGLRNNPDWLMISEVRGEEALDLLSAALTGHSIMTTLHATGADNIPSRLSNMVSMNAESPDYDALQLDIVSVLNLGVHMEMVVDDDTGRIYRQIREIFEYTEFRQGVGIIGRPIYQVIQEYKEPESGSGLGTYERKLIKNGLSDKLLDKIKNKREIHNVPECYKNKNEY